VIGELRLLNIHMRHERGTMAVTAGASRDGMIGIAQAEALVADGEAKRLWRDECPPESVVGI
jgi:hypothetical protein